MPDGRIKILDLSWSAITDETDTIVRLMLCVRDVTELRALAAETSEQKRRLEMIGEILAINQEKFHHFIESSTSFISENERIIREHRQANGAAIAELFRNMHTIKGNARTYSLQYLTDIVHETEQSYDELRKPDAQRTWDQEGLVQELARVREVVESYAEINEVSLGRKGPGQGGNARAIPDDRYRAYPGKPASTRSHERRQPGRPDRDARLGASDLAPARNRKYWPGPLRRAGLAAFAREGTRQGCARRPHSRQRYPPAQSRQRCVEKRVHALLRNSMDHGIETPEARTAQGKTPVGTIDINVQLEEDAVRITLRDDGRGLALGRIRNIAIERGWVGSDEKTSDEEIADLIFRPGFSTAEKVTEVSGRGVGMDAVRDFLKRANGSIKLRFTDDREGAEFRQFETVVCLPDDVAVESAGTRPQREADEVSA